MTVVAFAGSIYADDPGVVERILRAWVPQGQLRGRVRLSGQEFVTDTDTFCLYAHDAEGFDGTYYLLNGEMKADLAYVGADLYRLWKLCRAEQIEAGFEYAEVDEDGNYLGEELHVP